MSAAIDISHNKAQKRFETTINGSTGYISYQNQGDSIVYEHTIVPEALGGNGVASALVKHALNYAEAQQKKVVPQCSFVAAYISKHPEYQQLIG